MIKRPTRIFNIATFQRDSYLYKAIDSIYPQADIINICLNSHEEVPEPLRNDKKINCFLTDNSIGAGFKFYSLMDSNGYYFTIDDDFIYPSDYAQYLIDKYNYYKGKCIVTLHGKVFKKYPIISYYASPRFFYQVLKDVNEDTIVHIPGTAVSMFHTNLLKFSYKDIVSTNMADIWLGKFADLKNIKIICLSHKGDWLKYQCPKGGGIWDNFRIDTQTRLINSFINQDSLPKEIKILLSESKKF